MSSVCCTTDSSTLSRRTMPPRRSAVVRRNSTTMGCESTDSNSCTSRRARTSLWTLRPATVGRDGSSALTSPARRRNHSASPSSVSMSDGMVPWNSAASWLSCELTSACASAQLAARLSITSLSRPLRRNSNSAVRSSMSSISSSGGACSRTAARNPACAVWRCSISQRRAMFDSRSTSRTALTPSVTVVSVRAPSASSSRSEASARRCCSAARRASSDTRSGRSVSVCIAAMAAGNSAHSRERSTVNPM
mmetsp:Transcript_24463/g.92396  ORF Transcript_24463/g.92396 Transcript_24463/m.92396 type:complete len:250 (+) Transcript_24463:367-1116(+)